MKDFILYSLLLVLVVELVILYSTNSRREETKVLAEKSTSIPSLTPTSTPTVLPTASPSPIPTPVKTATPIPEPSFTSEQINGFIDRFASEYGVDPNLLRHIALCESGFNPFAYQSGYAGLFQFGPVTWQNLRNQIGEDPDIDFRYNAEEAIQTAAYALHINDAGIWPNCVH